MSLTQRDFEIIRFILNMKFASVADIHQKFFKFRKDGGISTSEWYARERLRILTENGYITSTRYRFETKCYYIGTKYGYQIADSGLCEDVTAKHIDRIDVRTFEHDQKVMQCRLLLEEHEKVSGWQSDRQLKSTYLNYNAKSTRDSAPDGVYRSLAGQNTAFEYEIAKKSKQRYRDKIRKYVESIRYPNNSDKPKYSHVRIVCEKESVQKLLLDETKIYKGMFTVEMADEFFGRFKSQKVEMPIQLSCISMQ